MPIREGWEVSPDRVKKFEEMMEANPIGDPIITSKCQYGGKNGLLVCGENGFAWAIKAGYGTKVWDLKKKKWIRWHDVVEVNRKKKGEVEVVVVQRKNEIIQTYKSGNPKTKKIKLKVNKNKKEEKEHWKEREEAFVDVITEIYNNYKVDTPPETSDSRP